VGAAEREGVASWDLLLDGRQRPGVRLTLIHEPTLGVVVWVHYAPPLADNLRKIYTQLLRWNDDFPFVKFSLADDDRPMLSTELMPAALDAEALGLAIARLLAVCDRLYLESAGWVERLGRPVAGAAPAGLLLLERYRHDLGELVAADYDEVRTAARVIVIDPDDRVLLLAARDPADGRLIWFVPGGGVERGETLAQAARRELAEEVPQAADLELIGPVWTRRHDFSWNSRRVSQTEFFFVGRLARPFPAESVALSGAEAESFAGARWANAGELAGWPPETIMAPRRLADLLPAILAGDYPAAPIDVGI
jgi:8-oxo-dGTP pyrophosphatase MutT (NUDIX family)